ncbi:hypothetical protein Tco_1362686 [Tanacetum coccineum]
MVDERGRWEYYHLGRASEEIFQEILASLSCGNNYGLDVRDDVRKVVIHSNSPWRELEVSKDPKKWMRQTLNVYYCIQDRNREMRFGIRLIPNRGTWKLSQLKKLSFEEVKEEFDKLVKQVESFAPINFEATKANLKRFGEKLQTKTSKRLKDDEAKDV